MQADYFPFEVYRFLPKSIRDADKNQGGDFLERYLGGAPYGSDRELALRIGSPQELFERIHGKIKSILDLFDVDLVADAYLQYLKDFVGFGPDLDNVTVGLTDNELRLLIKSAVSLWRQKAFEAGLELVIQAFISGRSSRIHDWFYYQSFCGVSRIGEKLIANDPFLIGGKTFRPDVVEDLGTGSIRFYLDDLLGGLDRTGTLVDVGHGYYTGGTLFVMDEVETQLTVSRLNNRNIVETAGSLGQTVISTDPEDYRCHSEYSDRESTIRVVDETGLTLNRTLLSALVDLFRGHGERYDILFLDFADDFETEPDQWIFDPIANKTIEDTELTIHPSTSMLTNTEYDQFWRDYVFTTRAMYLSGAATFKIYFYYVDTDDYYFLEIDTSAETGRLAQMFGGVQTWLGAAFSLPIDPDLYFVYRIVARRINQYVYFRIYLDGALQAERSIEIDLKTIPFAGSDSYHVSFPPFGHTNYSIRMSADGGCNQWFENKADGEFDIKLSCLFTGEVSWEVTEHGATAGTQAFVVSDSEAVAFAPLGHTNYAIKLTPTENVNVWYESKADGSFVIKTSWPITGSVDWEIEEDTAYIDAKAFAASAQETVTFPLFPHTEYSVRTTAGGDNVKAWYEKVSGSSIYVKTSAILTGEVSYEVTGDAEIGDVGKIGYLTDGSTYLKFDYIELWEEPLEKVRVGPDP